MKQSGHEAAAQLAKGLNVSYEAVRKELAEMERAGLVSSRLEKSKRGRPSRKWQFTVFGEHLFPKDYDSILGSLLRILTGPSHSKAAVTVLEDLAMEKAEAMLALAKETGESDAILSLYGAADEYISVTTGPGRTEVTEKNCPILSIAREFPVVCSVSTNALSKTFGKRVVRTSKFQEGHGCCTFAVTEETYDGTFRIEDSAPTIPTIQPKDD